VFVQALGGDAVHLHGADEIMEALNDFEQGGPGDEGEIQRIDQPFKIDIGQVLQAEGKPQGIEFFSRYLPYMEGISTAM